MMFMLRLISTDMLCEPSGQLSTLFSCKHSSLSLSVNTELRFIGRSSMEKSEDIAVLKSRVVHFITEVHNLDISGSMLSFH